MQRLRRSTIHQENARHTSNLARPRRPDNAREAPDLRTAAATWRDMLYVSMSNPYNQHWLPQFYLRRFGVPGWRDKKNAKIWVMDTETGGLEEQKIRNVAATGFLYSHVKDDG